MTLKQIVITGGPCAGKTTCLSTLEQRLTEKGCKVITVPEASTEMTLSGIQVPEVGILAYEKMLIEFQLAKEKMAKDDADYAAVKKQLSMRKTAAKRACSLIR